MTNESYNVHLQQSRQIYIKIQILNINNIILDELQGLAIDGSINIDSSSAIRRTCDLKFVLKTRFIPSPTSPFWMNKRIKIFVGIKNILNNSIQYFNMGIFLIQNPSIDISITEKTISIQGVDLMAYLDGTIGGQLTTKLVIEANTPINQAIKSTLQTFGAENNFIIDNSSYVLPYKIEKDIGSTVYEVLKELNDCYMYFEMFYDADGMFIWRETPHKLNDPIMWNFNDKDLKTSISTQIEYSNIKNHIKVWGKLKDDGSQPVYEWFADASSIFSKESLGEPVYRSLGINESKYYEVEQCTSRNQYEQWLHGNFAKKLSISCIPIYFLEPNNLIYVNNNDNGVEGKYVVTSISIPLKFDGIMSLQGYELT